MNTNKLHYNLNAINSDQRLYVLKGFGGYSCIGFDRVYDQTVKLLKELKSNINIQDLPEKGSVDLFYLYQTLIDYVSDLNLKTGFRSNVDLNPKLIGLEGKRIEAKVYGEKKVFTVGKSYGWVPCHLEIKRVNGRWHDSLPSDPNEVEIIRIIK